MTTWIYKWSRSITKIFYGRHRGEIDMNKTFSYTWSDQHFTVPAWSDVTFEVKWWWSNNAAWWKSTWTKHFDEETELSVMVWWRWNRSDNWTTYWFGWSTTYGWRWWWGLSWIFTWSEAIWANSAARALIIAGWAWGWRTWGWAWWWTNWQNWNGGSYWYAWAWWTQTWRWSGGNTRSEQFRWWGWSWTYWFGWGGWWRWGNGSWWDWSWDDDAQAGWGSWYVWRVENWATTVWWWSAAWTDWTAKITYTVPALLPTEYVEWYLWNTKIRPNTDVSRLPIEYQELEYIESTWAQRINTWYTHKSTSEFEIKFRNISAINTYRTLLWSRTDTSNNAFWIWWMNGKSYYELSPTNIEVTNSNLWWFETGKDYLMEFKWKKLTNNWNVVNSSVNFTHNWGRPVYLFAWNANWQTQPFEAAASRIYYCKLFEDGVLVHEYIPCYRRKDWVVWMYDIVNNTFYANSWTWVFNKWPEVNIPQIPEIYQEVKYIWSNAFWPRIDTWITPNQNTVMQFKVMPLWVFGGSIIWAYDNWMSDTQDHRIFNYSSQIYYDLPWGSWSWNRIYWGTFNANTVYEFEAWDWYVKNIWATTNLISWSAVNFTWNTTIKLNDNNASYSRWFYVKIFDWSRLVRWMLPCKRKSDNVVWMYDLVSKTFFTNIWSWEFVAGPNSAKVRYIRNYVNWSNVNNACHFVELHAFVWSTNVALNKTVTLYKWSLYSGTPRQPAAFVDWDTNTNNYVDLWSYSDWIWWALQVDLWSVYDLDYIVLWHYYSDSRAYKWNVLQVSEDGENRRTVYDSNVSWTYNESSSWRTFYL